MAWLWLGWIVEVPQVQPVEAVRQFGRIDFLERIMQVDRSIRLPREIFVEVPQTLVQKRIVEMLQVQQVDCVMEVAWAQTQIVVKHVAKPVCQLPDRIVKVPLVTVMV